MKFTRLVQVLLGISSVRTKISYQTITQVDEFKGGQQRQPRPQPYRAPEQTQGGIPSELLSVLEHERFPRLELDRDLEVILLDEADVRHCSRQFILQHRIFEDAHISRAITTDWLVFFDDSFIRYKLPLQVLLAFDVLLVECLVEVDVRPGRRRCGTGICVLLARQETLVPAVVHIVVDTVPQAYDLVDASDRFWTSQPNAHVIRPVRSFHHIFPDFVQTLIPTHSPAHMNSLVLCELVEAAQTPTRVDDLLLYADVPASFEGVHLSV